MEQVTDHQFFLQRFSTRSRAGQGRTFRIPSAHFSTDRYGNRSAKFKSIFLSRVAKSQNIFPPCEGQSGAALYASGHPSFPLCLPLRSPFTEIVLPLRFMPETCYGSPPLQARPRGRCCHGYSLGRIACYWVSVLTAT